jgi:hypothetical protein
MREGAPIGSSSREFKTGVNVPLAARSLHGITPIDLQVVGAVGTVGIPDTGRAFLAENRLLR